MNHQRITLKDQSPVLNTISCLFGLLVVAIGIVNIFWGDDPFFGLFIIILSLIYFPPITRFIAARSGVVITGFIKVLAALFILWASAGVGELFQKVDMMVNDIHNSTG